MQLVEASLADKLGHFLKPFCEISLGWSSSNLVLSDVHHIIFLYEETTICTKQVFCCLNGNELTFVTTVLSLRNAFGWIGKSFMAKAVLKEAANNLKK